MKGILAATIVSWMLLSSASALQCLQCQNATCVSATCDAGSTCLTSSYTITSPGLTNQSILKTCVPASTCLSGFQTFAQSMLNVDVLFNASCCSTDNCNSDTLDFPTMLPSNNLQCYTCDPTTPNCIRTTMQCKGVEDRCFQSSVTVGSTTSQFLGCASVNLCTKGSNLAISTSVANMTCCGSSLCNSAPAATTAVHLLLGLLLFSFY